MFGERVVPMPDKVVDIDILSSLMFICVPAWYLFFALRALSGHEAINSLANFFAYQILIRKEVVQVPEKVLGRGFLDSQVWGRGYLDSLILVYVPAWYFFFSTDVLFFIVSLSTNSQILSSMNKKWRRRYYFMIKFDNQILF